MLLCDYNYHMTHYYRNNSYFLIYPNIFEQFEHVQYEYEVGNDDCQNFLTSTNIKKLYENLEIGDTGKTS